MNNLTPAIAIRARDLAANWLAAEELMNRIPTNKVNTILDIRYGLGCWAKSALARFSGAFLTGYESDAVTVSMAWSSSRTTVVESVWPDGKRVGQVDLLLADFNIVTALNQGPLTEAIEWARPTYLIFTDVGASKLHLNYRSYGLTRPDIEEYWRTGFNLEGYRLLEFRQFHRAASTALWERKKPS